jgi:diguanylate cyclase (GGDEF)-like protein
MIMAEKTYQKNLVELGFDLVDIFAKGSPSIHTYKRLVGHILRELDYMIDQLRFYVIDEERELLEEELTYNIYSGWSQGYDYIPLYQIEQKKDEKIIVDDNYIKIILRNGRDILGLMEFRLIIDFSEINFSEFVKMTDIIGLALGNVLIKKELISGKDNTEISIKINNELQAIDNLDELIQKFFQLTLKYFKFDRITVVLYDENNNISEVRGVNEKGQTFTTEDFPVEELPVFTGISFDYIPFEYGLGYWLPLKTNTRIVGAVLFDNIYTLYRIPDTVRDNLRLLSSQFANAINNIQMNFLMQKAAYSDLLTGIHNRNYLEIKLKDIEKAENLPFSVIMGDLNGLKITNDVFGHSAGDWLLKKTAEILQRNSSDNDLVFRWGGDEFVMFLPGKGRKEAEKVCRIIGEECEEINKESKWKLSLSLGTATKETGKLNLMELVKRAEDRMYKHKLLETRSYRNALISSLAETLSEKNIETVGHAERMTSLAMRLGERMDLSSSELDDLRLLALLHDIGKVAINDDILNKPGPLNEKEWVEMKKHSEVGYRIAQASLDLAGIADFILYHHERWDGTGYPLGKKGKEIPLLSRIISVVDAYDVMTHPRPYKEAISQEEAVKELKRCAGTQFDPEIVEIFTTLDLMLV